jgi:Protein of unknown function (DUF3307)
MTTNVNHDLIPHVGGWLALLVTLHFAVDWIFQSHDEAMRKPREWHVRAKHCAVYTLPFAALLSMTSWDIVRVFAMSLAVFLSHFVEDTYLPVLWWAKHVRKPPQMRRVVFARGRVFPAAPPPDGRSPPAVPAPSHVPLILSDDGMERDPKDDFESKVVSLFNGGSISVKEAQESLDLDGFIAFVSEPLGKILLVAIDQIVHILFLLPAAYMMAAQP